MATNDTSDLAQAFCKGLDTPPLQTVTEWAEANRFLDSRTSAEPGRYRPDRTPYAVEPMDKLSAHDDTEQVVLMWAAQVGKTEIGNNWLGSIIDYSPGPTLAVQSTVDLANDFSKQRIAPMIELSPALRDKVAPPRSRDSSNTLRNKEFAGGALYIVGANAPAGLRSKPIRFVFFDEVDSYPLDAGGEGDPIDLAMKRTATFRNRKILMTSTPTIKGESRIEAAFAESDQRRYEIPCPRCGTFQALVWKQVKWPKDRPEDASYQCIECEMLINDAEKAKALAQGHWQETAESARGIAGYHLSALYSPWVRFGELAKEFRASAKDPVRLQVFVNTRLAETFEDQGEAVDGHSLLGRREPFGVEAKRTGKGPEVPAGVLWLTCAVDTQDDRLEALVVGWGAGEECYVIDHRVWYGDPAAHSGQSPEGVWAELDIYLGREWLHEGGNLMRLQATCVDSGGHHASAVRTFAKQRAGRNVWAIVGSRTSTDPIWPKKPKKTKVGLFYRVGVGEAKWKVYRRLRIPEAGAGYVHFSDSLDGAWFEQLTVEKRRTRYVKGRPVHYWWKPDHARNEAFDLMVYNVAALHGLYLGGRNLEQAAKRAASASTKKRPKAKVADIRPKYSEQAARRRPKRGGYLRR